MEIHNIAEDIVLSTVNDICDTIEQQGNPEKLCICGQCRLDTACYVLNRIPPHYVISNRGVARVDIETIERQQQEADIVALVHEGIRRVSHIQRPYVNHSAPRTEAAAAGNKPVFNIPTIIGRAFNGIDFSPAEAEIQLFRNGAVVPMKDYNWQNPYMLVKNTAGTFTFWPKPLEAEAAGIRETFEYSIKIAAPGFEELSHFFKIPVISELQTAESFSMQRTFKLPDLYLFPPGNDDNIGLA
ncbi:late competence development ComFB family protein [Breznakiella homolactica]|uniref:Late competence development ComFB family protein n=1 Tax=Breznakiella homolactica TaxID=2798577 RepID=A0A7T7XRE7_9SPIR|nr:late competence development ComFB family protein [Breznakiella homolactica]QQO11112.1 late competence development ComFB family protein [Breznakiella homolactica]